MERIEYFGKREKEEEKENKSKEIEHTNEILDPTNNLPTNHPKPDKPDKPTNLPTNPTDYMWKLVGTMWKMNGKLKRGCFMENIMRGVYKLNFRLGGCPKITSHSPSHAIPISIYIFSDGNFVPPPDMCYVFTMI